MELTKEHFDQVVKSLVTKEHAEATEERIVKRIDDSQEELARMTSDGFTRTEQRFDKLEELLEVKQDVLTLKRQMLEIRAALHLSV